MAPIIRIKARWQGFQGGPGYSIFHLRDFSSTDPTKAEAEAGMARIRLFFQNISGIIPAVASVQVESDVEVIEETTGELLSVIAATSTSVVAGGASSTAKFATAAGGLVTWRTSLVHNGRRIRGRTFLVPLSSAAFDVDGTLSSSAVSDINTAATALANPSGAPDMGVWARPSAPGASDGVWAAVTSFSIPDKGSVLRSRRD